MHWHAIRQSNALAENQGLPSSSNQQQLDGNHSMAAEDEPDSHETSPPIPEGDDASDLRSDADELALHMVDSWDSSSAIDDSIVPFVQLGPPRTLPDAELQILDDRGFISESYGPGTIGFEIVDPENPPRPPPPPRERPTYPAPESVASSDDGGTAYSDKPWLKVNIPLAPANNLTPYAYRRALQQRIDDAALLRGHRYDTKRYTPTFVYDCLVFPGSLANICEKGSAEDMVWAMTPALLPGFGVYYWPHNHEPCVLHSPRAGDYVQGMLIFGQSKQTRRKIHEFYRDYCKRIKVEVEFEVLWSVPKYMKTDPTQKWLRLRRRVWAHTWIWKDAKHGANEYRVSQEEKLGWRYEDHLAWEMDQAQKEELKIVPAGWIDDDRESIASGESSDDSQVEDGEGKDEDEDEGWESNGQDETGSWEEGSGAGAAVEWTDEAWAALPGAVTDEAGAVDASGGEEDLGSGGALDRDYERKGSARMW